MEPIAAVIGTLTALVGVRSYYVNKIVPEPYLDEVFHIPQALHYCAGHFRTWDPKLTTPAGLYLLSYPLSFVGSCVTPSLRGLNALGVSLLIPLLVYRIRQTLHPNSDIDAAHTALNIALFPLLSFFANLYYTDIWSTCWLLCAHLAALRNRPWTSSVFCLASLWFRQTNVVWTCFIAGTYLVRRLTEVNKEHENEEDMVALRDPLFERFQISDIFFATPLTLAATALRNPLNPTIVSTAPFLLLPLSGFVAFLKWNDARIVLGDAEAHTAGLHSPQILYFTLFSALFSWPLYLPHILQLITRVLNDPFPISAITAFSATAVYFNTVLHPYLLADNRHYTFYLFRRLLLPMGAFMAPLYAVAIQLQGSVLERTGTRVSWVLLWLGATTVTLVGAPLVEPRYFIVPWVMWRCQARPRGWVRWVETGWFLVVGGVTSWVFLERGFEWRQEPGRVQRFMW